MKKTDLASFIVDRQFTSEADPCRASFFLRDVLQRKMSVFFLFCCVTVVVTAAENDWVWKDGEQQESKIDKRYQVNENVEDFEDEGPLIGFRPQNTGAYGPNGRPIVPAASYPGNKGVLVGPGGPTGIIKRPPYTGNIDEGALHSGFVPSWVKDDPRYREYDVCRCRYSFNCPSAGVKFGSCAKDKKYCCFSSRRYPALVPGYGDGAQYPVYPSVPNKYGPASFAHPPNYYGNRRPQGSFVGGNRYPGNYHIPGEAPSAYPRPHGSTPYEQNYDYNDYDFYGRSLKKNQTEDASADRKA
ncbi:uncharacterized protein LOC108631618 isoform X2 [Ceratina calcarata]|uniref:Uncharacterized protein LOC108631618 isoform X2 n=1 Tax=Ceratina calcarata TaxID=156304 RepID=A0AAJ7SCN9_9HYME|nr:uncharacterized protein LOC108631618 isoform X2 [Ceratina calcarata]